MRRSLWVALALFGVLLLYVLLTQTGNRGYNTLRLPALPKLAADDLVRIELDRAQGRLILEKKDAGWQIVEPFAFPADKFKVENAQRALAGLRLSDLIAERAGAEADYGLTSATAIGVAVRGGQGQALRLSVGKLNQAGTHTFVRRPDRPAVYQVFGDLAGPLSPAPADWRSLQIYDFSPDLVHSLSVSRGRQVLQAAKVEEKSPQTVGGGAQPVTRVALPGRVVWKAQGQELNEAKVNQLLGNLCRLTALRIEDAAPPLHQSGAGPTLAVVKFRLPQEHSLTFLSFNAQDKTYRARADDRPTVYVLSEWVGKSLLKNFQDLK